MPVVALIVLTFVLTVVGVPQAAVVTSAAPIARASAPLPARTSKYVPIGPVRLADTRPASGAYGFSRPVSTVYRVKVAGRRGVPLNATEAVVNVTALSIAGPGRAAVYGTGDPVPTMASIVADARGQSVSNLVHVRIGANGSIDIRRTVGMHVVVDLLGVYVPVAGPVADGRLTTFGTGAKHLLTSKSVAAGSSTLVNLSKVVPAGAEAAVVSLTVDHAPKGSYSIYGAGYSAPPTWTLVTDTNGQTRTNMAIVRLSTPSRSIRVSASRGGRISVDVIGYYTGPTASKSTDGLFVPAKVLRRLDKMSGKSMPAVGPVTFEFSPGTALSVSAVVGNLLVAGMWDPGTFTAKPAGIAATSVVVARTTVWPQSVASHFILRTSTRGIALSTTVGGFMVVDVTGWFLGSRPKAVSPPVKNRSLPLGTVNALKWRDAQGAHVRSVQYSLIDNLEAIADANIGAVYNHLRTLQKAGNIMVFGHRTKNLGIFRYIDTMQLGSTFSLRSTNGHWYNYRVVYVGVTTATYSAISNITHYFSPTTAQLVACSKQNGQPTDLHWRITVTGRLVSVT